MSRVGWVAAGIGVGVLGAVVLARRARAARLTESPAAASSPASAMPATPATAPESGRAPAPPASGWVWPVPPYEDGRRPSVSDGWGSGRAGGTRRHRGVDLMYRRQRPNELVDRFPPGTPNGTRRHFMPNGTPALAARAGVVTLLRPSSGGVEIVLRHEPGWRTYYQHLETPLVRLGQRVEAGTPIGIIGANPLDAERIKHLHFEVWHGAASPTAIDPQPLLARWTVVAPSVARRIGDPVAAQAVDSFTNHATEAIDGRYSRAIDASSARERKS